MSVIRHLPLLVSLTATTLGAQATTPSQRICIAPPTAQMASGSSTDAANAVRESFTSFLTGPSLAVTPLTARLASQAREEAKRRSGVKSFAKLARPVGAVVGSVGCSAWWSS